MKDKSSKPMQIETGKRFRTSVSRFVSGTCDSGPRRPDFQDWKQVRCEKELKFMNYIFLIVGVAMVLLGSAFFTISLVSALRKRSKIKRFVKTTGVVTNVEKSSGMRQSHSTPRNTLYRPTVRFQSGDGRTVDYAPDTSNSWSNYRVGEQVPVFYDPQGTEKPIIGRSFQLWYGLAVFGFVGFFFALTGVCFTLFGLMFS
jgi:hypothetical protein